MRLDQRGAPDYSHYDYAAETVRLFEQGRRDGEADRISGKRPNQYLYVDASPSYSLAKGYREGYGLRPVVATQQPHATKMNVAAYADYFVEWE